MTGFNNTPTHRVGLQQRQCEDTPGVGSKYPQRTRQSPAPSHKCLALQIQQEFYVRIETQT